MVQRGIVVPPYAFVAAAAGHQATQRAPSQEIDRGERFVLMTETTRRERLHGREKRSKEAPELSGQDESYPPVHPRWQQLSGGFSQTPYHGYLTPISSATGY